MEFCQDNGPTLPLELLNTLASDPLCTVVVEVVSDDSYMSPDTTQETSLSSCMEVLTTQEQSTSVEAMNTDSVLEVISEITIPYSQSIEMDNERKIADETSREIIEEILAAVPYDDISKGETKTNRGVALTKHSIRKQVWTHFDKLRLVTFPRPAYGRIPNFMGSADAANKLVELDVFKNASVIKVNTDKTQDNVRLAVLQAGKRLIVQTPCLHSGVFLEVESSSREYRRLRKAVTTSNMLKYSASHNLETDVKIDVVVMGSVAVSKEGHRVGKGEGFSDLEFAFLSHIGAITEKTVVITTVHDCQVYETLPKEIFQAFDVPVDIIVTPTQIINVQVKLPKPKNIIWSILCPRRLNAMSAMKELWDKEMQAGKVCQLRDDDSMRRRFYRVPRLFQNRPKPYYKSKAENDATKNHGSGKKEPEPSAELSSSNANLRNGNMQVENQGEIKKRKRFRHQAPIEFSLKVNNISSSVRVSDFRRILAEKNIKPDVITWRGRLGYAFIRFTNPRKNQKDTPADVENILASMKDLTVPSSSCSNNIGWVVQRVIPRKKATNNAAPEATNNAALDATKNAAPEATKSAAPEATNNAAPEATNNAAPEATNNAAEEVPA